MFFDIEGSFSIAKVTSAERLVEELPLRRRRGNVGSLLRLDDMISVRGMMKQEAVDNIKITAKKLLIVSMVDFRLMK